MIEDATKPNIEPFELYGEFDIEISEPDVTVQRGEESVALDIKDAAFVLGKSVRALERSLSGKWGNKLPDGWTARKAIINDSEEWQIVPPSGFNLDALIEHKRNYANKTADHGGLEQSFWPSRQVITQAATKLAFGKPIEIQLLRELAATHKELSEERRAHLEDLRLLTQLQASMRLLENNSAETANLKAELIEAQKDLISLKHQYQQLLSTPWWKRVFSSKP